MAETAIEWTDTTWNPVTGCSKVSEGCDNCYAETLALGRLAGKPGYPGLPWTPENAAENVVLRPDRLDQPARWRKPRRVFVNSMSDLFHPRVPSRFINDVWMAMYNAPRHTYQVLTKRPKRMRDWTLGAARAKGWPADEIWPDWIWVGTSIENREYVHRADLLRETPAAVRFISAEPLLGPLVFDCNQPAVRRGFNDSYHDACWYDGRDAPELDLTDIDWLIVGGESGPNHRPMRLDWARDLRDAAQTAGTAFFMKQDSGAKPGRRGRFSDEAAWPRAYPEIAHAT